MEKHVLWVICFLLLTHIAEGQQVLRKDSVRQRDSADIVPARVVSAPANDISNVFPLDKKVAGYTPVTPSASRLMNEINHPVDYGTGAVDVSIPIHFQDDFLRKSIIGEILLKSDIKKNVIYGNYSEHTALCVAFIIRFCSEGRKRLVR